MDDSTIAEDEIGNTTMDMAELANSTLANASLAGFTFNDLVNNVIKETTDVDTINRKQVDSLNSILASPQLA